MASGIVSCFDMRLLFPSLLLLCAIGAVAQQTQPHQTSPPPGNGTKQQQGSDNKAGNPQPLPNPTVHTAENQPSPTKEKPGTQEESQCILKKAVAPDTWANWALFIAAIVAAVIALRTLKAIQRESGEIKSVAEAAASNAKAASDNAASAKASADVSQKSLALASETAQKQLRAYVCVESACVRFPRPDVPEAQVHFKNYGQTPAYKFRGWIHTWFAEYPLIEVLPPAPNDLSKGTELLAPGRKSIFVSPKKPPLPPHYIPLLGTMKFTLYVYGEVYYTDAFGNDQWTKYRLIYGGSAGTRKVPGKDEWLLSPDTQGNEAS